MPRPDEPHSPAASLPEAPSKTRRKAAMHALQDLGEALVGLDPSRLAELGLPERLVEAILAARGIRAHEGRRRQMQFIGKLMREIDPEPIRAALDRFAAGIPSDQARVAAAERWRDDLLRDDGALERFVADHPGTDRTMLSTLVRAARAERTRGGPPHRYRELFRRLKTAVGDDA
jgi:ribosome-associated protein